MQSEESLLRKIFGENKWKEKYTIDYCDQCETFMVSCPVCNFGSCSGGGCKECHDDTIEFHNTIKKTNISDYLTEEEKLTFTKIHALKRHMWDSICLGESEIDFDKLKEDGKLSQVTEELFKNLLKHE